MAVSSMEAAISKGLAGLHLGLNNNVQIIEDCSSSRFDFTPVEIFVETTQMEWLKKKFVDESVASIAAQYVANGETLSADNYKSVMKLAVATELWNEYATARKHEEKTYDTFFANVQIERSNVDFTYTMPIEGHPLRPAIGKKINFTTDDGTLMQLQIVNILDDRLVLSGTQQKVAPNQRYRGPNRKVPLKKVYFLPSQGNSRRIINGLEHLEDEHLSVLFPHPELKVDPTRIGYSTVMEPPGRTLNKEQKEVVDRLVNYTSPHPFVLFGPPGTGKTHTLIGSLYNIYQRSRSDWKFRKDLILIAAPSNTAVNIIVRALLNFVPKDEICRLVSFAKCDSMDQDVKRVATTDTREVEEKLRQKSLRFLCGTIQVLGKLNRNLVKASQIFVDEAGQATLADIHVIWPSLMRQQGGQLIVAGDPFQLGPVVKSDGVKYLGLDQSMLHFLKLHELYQKDDYTRQFDGKNIIQLVRNYRSVPKLLKVPNQLFYDDTLIPEIDEQRDKHKIFPPVLVGAYHPLVFHETHSQQSKHEGMPSWQNIDEADIVINYVTKLLRFIKKSDIGIISPYGRQVRVIKERLIGLGLLARPTLAQANTPKDGILVGTVEVFQGDERKVIILSTVRSEGIGFLREYQRFNVAVTRAKDLLIVIGNSKCLMSDMNWRQLIRNALNNAKPKVLH